MARQADLLSYLPPFLQDVEQFQIYADITNPELNRIWELNEKLFRNQFIVTADEEGITHFEKFPNLAPIGTLEERRQRLLDNWNLYPLFTRQVLYERLKKLCGEGHFELDISHFSDYEIYLSLNLPLIGNLSEVIDLFSWNYMLPANLLYQINITLEKLIELNVLLNIETLITSKHNINYISSGDFLYTTIYNESEIINSEEVLYNELNLEIARSLLQQFLTDNNLSQESFNTLANFYKEQEPPNTVINPNRPDPRKIQGAINTYNDYETLFNNWLETSNDSTEEEQKETYQDFIIQFFNEYLNDWQTNYIYN